MSKEIQSDRLSIAEDSLQGSDSPQDAVPSSIGGKLTPLMQQYWDIKQAHADKIVLFRMGDFFEMFHRDAETAAPVLGIALTSRNKKAADETPMCGVPHHSIANSINKLLANGFKVAICDQIEDPKTAKGLVKRAVTRILSPGVVYDPDTLDGLKANYLASFDEGSLAFLDTTTGESFYFLTKDQGRREQLILNLQPVEIVIPQRLEASFKTQVWPGGFQPIVTVHDGRREKLSRDGRPDNEPDHWPESAYRLLDYVVHMQGATALETIAPFEARELLDRMEWPQAAIRHLEIFSTYKGEAKGSLFHAINRCKTASGARLLRSWLSFPLVSLPAIQRRHDLIDSWLAAPDRLQSARSILSRMGDVQRRLAKMSAPNVNPRDLQALAESVKAGIEVSAIVPQGAAAGSSRAVVAPDLLAAADRVVRDIESTLSDEPPVQIKNGGVIRAGFSRELDELTELSTNSHELILKLEARERDLTGISSLKVRFNNVFGYYIEITNTHKDKVPKDRYERKQTLANAERYLTPELAELESKVLSAQAKRLDLEQKLFTDLVARCLLEARSLLQLAAAWAEVDVVSSVAHLSIEQGYCRPRLEEGGSLELKASRHPVIEQSLSVPFVANDIRLEREGCLLLTGPNMAGKSTLMRQVAIAAVLAQAGCFVPAREAKLPLFDRVFTRIGASDFLSEGLSTFMVEMKETAEMLNSATENSLVVLDEIGRGTSTYDGMSLAQAILEFLLESRRCMTLFATHYHELTALAATFPALKNAHMRIHESPAVKPGQGAVITFLHQLAEGAASKSYGIHVAKLAGLPASVTRRASAILKRLESETSVGDDKQMTLMNFLDRAVDDLHEGASSLESALAAPEGMVSDALQNLQGELTDLDVSQLTPLEALNRIAKWQQSLS